MKRKIDKLKYYFKIVLTIILAVPVKITPWEVSNTQFQTKITQEPYDLNNMIVKCKNARISKICEGE